MIAVTAERGAVDRTTHTWMTQENRIEFEIQWLNNTHLSRGGTGQNGNLHLQISEGRDELDKLSVQKVIG